jgi:5S rRNA maturation endonuclease (ribonuclease M5)
MNLLNEQPRDAARRLAAGAISDGFQAQALHEYTDAEGQSLHWRIRLKHPGTGEKWIRPMQKSAQGFTLGEPAYSAGKPLYNLASLVARLEEEVVVVEGEWVADALKKIGVLATTSGAADSAATADWSSLAGRHVTIWPDNDPAGRRYADTVVKALQEFGCEVRVINVEALELVPKGDAVDWLVEHPDATVADVLALACITDNMLAAPMNEGDWPSPQPLAAATAPEPYPLEALPKLSGLLWKRWQGSSRLRLRWSHRRRSRRCRWLPKPMRMSSGPKS